MFMVTAAAMEKAQQKQMKQQQQRQAPPKPAVKDKDAAAAPVKDKDKGPQAAAPEKGPPPRVVEKGNEEKVNPPEAGKNEQPAAPAGNGGAVNPPAPEPDPAEVRAVVYAITALSVLLTLAYAGFCVVCFQSGRRAIRREMTRLVGDPHDEHH
jgi:hypothetical protein